MTPIPATHADHDPLVIAAHAAGDAEGAELDTALALVAACPDCAALHHDLRAIASALPTLPDPVRSRDFRLSPGQAASLRPSAWRRLLAPLAGPRFAFAGPLGTGLATLGIAGFLVAGAVGMPIAGSAAAPGDTTMGSAGNGGGAYEYSAAASPGAEEKAGDASMAPALGPLEPQRVRISGSTDPVPPLPAAIPGGSVPPEGFGVPQAVPAESGPAESGPADASVAAPISNGGSAPVLPLVSGFALAVGLVLAGLRVAGRRLAAG